ncbi:MAG: hypothetical protein WBX27_20460 [Specibacter sp.]
MGNAMSRKPKVSESSLSGPPVEPHILELRIHGVRDTPPWEMLGVDQGDAVKVDGDDLGSFWIPKKPSGDRGPAPQRGSEVPNNIRREAYSWGSMARYAPVPGANILGKSAAVIRRIGWLMMLPFALCNAAYWMRPLAGRGAGESGGTPGGRGWRDANGGGTVRVFGFFLTLLLVASATAASVDLIGTQCIRAGQICSTLPGLLNGLASLDQLKRNFVLALLPLVMLLVIYVLSVVGRVRFSANAARHIRGGKIPAGATESSETATPADPILKTNGFWYSPMMPRATELLHLSGAGALITAMLAWDAVYSSVPECREVSTFFGPQCGGGLVMAQDAQESPSFMLTVIAARLDSFVVLLVAVAMLVAVTCRIVVSVSGNADVEDPRMSMRRIPNPVWHRELGWAWCLLGVVTALWLANAVLLWVHPEVAAVGSQAEQVNAAFLGIVLTPSLLVLAMVAMAIAGLGWRRGAGTITSLVLFAGAVACFIGGFVVLGLNANVLQRLALFIVAFVLISVLGLHLFRRRPGPSHKYEGWNGMGPGVIMVIALGVGLALSSVLVVGTANFLHGKLSLTGGTATPVTWRSLTTDNSLAPVVVPPVKEVPIYDHYGLALLLTVFVVGLVVGIAMCRQLLRPLRVLSTPKPNSMPVQGTKAAGYPNGHPEPARTPLGSAANLVLSGRRMMGLLHRGEQTLGWLAGTFLMGLLGTLAWGIVEDSLPGGHMQGALSKTEPFSSVVLGILAVAVVGGIVVSATATEIRPVGLLWDLMCFLPNAAHPLGPPCYAERVVPELSARIDDWLDSPQSSPGRQKVVISAHSLGSVLAVACLFARDAAGKDSSNIGLLTYGCQLRAYFGRLFPELFGPAVLGTRGSQSPSLWNWDPWKKQVDEDFSLTLETAPEQTLSHLLTTPAEGRPRWINLWRRTDYLGFPVNSYQENSIDRGADELDTSSYMLKLATHSDYPSSHAYETALAILLQRMGEPGVR